jgi:hypothetical protein
MNIKEQTIQMIEEVLKQNKKYYRSSEFPFKTHNGNYSTHQGAVLRYYLRENGYVNVRVSEISTQFFIDNQDSINKSLRGQPVSNIFLKPSNTIIMKASDYSFYMVKKPNFFPLNTGAKIQLAPLPSIKPAIIGMGEMEKGAMHMLANSNYGVGIRHTSDKQRNSVVITLIDKYTGRLNAIKQFYALNIDDLPLQECTDCEAHMRDLAEICRDLKSLV